MARKKSAKGPNNPYFGKFEEESHMAKRPIWTWILALPGLVLGAVIGIGTGEALLGPIFGAIMGIAVGSLIDKHREKKQDDASSDRP